MRAGLGCLGALIGGVGAVALVEVIFRIIKPRRGYGCMSAFDSLEQIPYVFGGLLIGAILGATAFNMLPHLYWYWQAKQSQANPEPRTKRRKRRVEP